MNVGEDTLQSTATVELGPEPSRTGFSDAAQTCVGVSGVRGPAVLHTHALSVAGELRK